MTNEQAQMMIDLRNALQAGKDLPAINHVCIVGQLLGNIIAFQDCRIYTPEHLMVIVMKNIEIGNQAALDSLTIGHC